VNGWNANPILDGIPNTSRVPALYEEVVNGLKSLLAEGATVTILPTSC
jgi:hypothetical protein